MHLCLLCMLYVLSAPCCMLFAHAHRCSGAVGSSDTDPTMSCRRLVLCSTGGHGQGVLGCMVLIKCPMILPAR